MSYTSNVGQLNIAKAKYPSMTALSQHLVEESVSPKTGFLNV